MQYAGKAAFHWRGLFAVLQLHIGTTSYVRLSPSALETWGVAMKIYAVLLAAAALTPIPASAKVILDVRATENQTSRMFSGTEAVTSVMEKSIVGIMEDREPAKKRTSLVILTLNKGEAPYNFGPENVTVTANGQSFVVLTYDQLVREERNRAKWRRVAGAFAAGSNSAGASNAGNSNGTFSAYGNDGSSAYGSFNSYDAGKAQAAQSQANRDNQAMMQNIRRNEQAALAALDSNMQTSTVDPGQSFGGHVSVELPKELRKVKEPTPALIVVTIGGELHQFQTMIVPAR